MRDALHYFDVAAMRYRSDPANSPAPATADQGARWVVTFWPHLDHPAWTPENNQQADVTYEVVVNHGRWVVNCECGSAQLACRTDHRMFCVDCENVAVGGRWVHVAWPDDPYAIERALSRRPVDLQNWLPGDDLDAENLVLAERTKALQ